MRIRFDIIMVTFAILIYKKQIYLAMLPAQKAEIYSASKLAQQALIYRVTATTTVWLMIPGEKVFFLLILID